MNQELYSISYTNLEKVNNCKCKPFMPLYGFSEDFAKKLIKMITSTISRPAKAKNLSETSKRVGQISERVIF